jgi:5-methylcytosine-specific restriction endonuclease McrA
MTMRDRRYNTTRWKRTRKLVIFRAGGLCQVRGPNCTIYATTAHHRLPSSQYPELFWDLTNLEASCGPCNAHGATVKNENRVNRMEIARLERVIENQEVQIAVLVARLAEYENGEAERTRAPTPKIH